MYGGQVFKLDLVMTSVIILGILAGIMYLAVLLLERFINHKKYIKKTLEKKKCIYLYNECRKNEAKMEKGKMKKMKKKKTIKVLH